MSYGPKPRPVEDRFWSKVDRSAEDTCWVWLRKCNKAGYGWFYFNPSTGPRLANRVSWELCVGSIPDGLYVLHHCDNPPCVNPSHLFLGTRKDNSDDMWSKNRGAPTSGDKNPRSKITEAQATELLEWWRTGTTTQKEIGLRYGLHPSQVSRIVNGKRRLALQSKV